MEEAVEDQEGLSDPEIEKKSPWFMLYGIILVAVVFGLIFSLKGDISWIKVWTPSGDVVRPSGDCYIYNNHEFCLVDGNWYTDILNGNVLYTVGFQYDPDTVRYIKIDGKLSEKFLDSDVYYVTFDPTKEDLKYTALASAELQLSMARAMMLPLKAACTKNHTDCKDVPIITCSNTDKPVFYVNEDEGAAKILFDDNCVTVSGKAEELVKAVDRLLYFWYGIMIEFKY